MKKILGLLSLLTIIALPARADAISSSEPPVIINPDVVITAFGGIDSLDFAEIFNQTDKPIDVTGWNLSFTIQNADGSCKQTFEAKPKQAGWLLPGAYFSFINGQAMPGDTSQAYFQPAETDTNNCPNATLSSVSLIDENSQIVQAVTADHSSIGPWVHRQRNNESFARDISGIFADDYKASASIKCRDDDPDGRLTLCSQPLYNPPNNSAGLQIMEILPHARDCSPLDSSSLDCADYIKLYNSGKSPIDLSGYRLRVGHKNDTESVTNTFDFNSALAPGQYFTLATRDDGKPLSLTDSGDYVWLEDAAGIKIYSPVIEYPSASSDQYVGASWVINGSGDWQWTSTPEPFAANVVTPLKTTETSSASTSTLKPCAVNQERNPLTNRCKLIVSASSLVPCSASQFRNPETNRCDSLVSTASSLVPCATGQERNPATNRCKSTNPTSSSLVPCQPGWTRNPDTNRCRKTPDVTGASTPKIQDVKGASTSRDYTGWIVALIAVIAALGYAAYEWRQELLTVFKKVTIRH